MIECVCMVQAGQVSAEAETGLRAAMDALARRAFDAPADINWIVVPANSGFTAGKPSTSVVVTMRSNRPLPQPERVALLQALCEIWTAGADRSMAEVVASISDPVA